MTGEMDLPDYRLIADLIVASADSVRRIDIPGAGHMPHLERPRDSARAILAFLTE